MHRFLPAQADGFFPADLVDGSQIAGAILSLIALVIALFAIVKSNRDLARERRIEHELEILRDLGKLLEQFGQGIVPQLRGSLLMLSGSQDLPMVRAALGVRPFDADLRRFTERYPSAPGFDEPTNVNRLGRASKYQRFRAVRDDGTALVELEEAIEVRVNNRGGAARSVARTRAASRAKPGA